MNGRHWVRFWGGATCRVKARKEQPPPLQVTRPKESAQALFLLRLPTSHLSKSPGRASFDRLPHPEYSHRAENLHVAAVAFVMEDYKTYLAGQVLSEDKIVSIPRLHLLQTTS